MRFFTLADWCGEWGRGNDPQAEYASHLDGIRDRLPPQLLALQETISLHDTRLRTFVLLPPDGSLRIELSSYSGEERIELVYQGVERFESSADPAMGLRGPHGYGDLGYDEVDVLPDGTFEHRILFSTGIEFRIVFRGFDLVMGTRTTNPNA